MTKAYKMLMVMNVLWLFIILYLFSFQDTLEELVKAEPMSESLKTQLNDLCRFSRDMGAQSERVSALIKEYNR